jgi:hypothetical protein
MAADGSLLGYTVPALDAHAIRLEGAHPLVPPGSMRDRATCNAGASVRSRPSAFNTSTLTRGPSA